MIFYFHNLIDSSYFIEIFLYFREILEKLKAKIAEIKVINSDFQPGLAIVQV